MNKLLSKTLYCTVCRFNVGDFVLIVWDITSKNYVVYQENKKNLVFLHPESINNLSLKFSSGKILCSKSLFYNNI